MGCAPPLLLDRWGLGGLPSRGVTGCTRKLGRATAGLCSPGGRWLCSGWPGSQRGGASRPVPWVGGAGECASGVGAVSVQSSLVRWGFRLCRIRAQVTGWAPCPVQASVLFSRRAGLWAQLRWRGL